MHLFLLHLKYYWLVSKKWLFAYPTIVSSLSWLFLYILIFWDSHCPNSDWLFPFVFLYPPNIISSISKGGYCYQLWNAVYTAFFFWMNILMKVLLRVDGFHRCTTMTTCSWAGTSAVVKLRKGCPKLSCPRFMILIRGASSTPPVVKILIMMCIKESKIYLSGIRVHALFFISDLTHSDC